MRRHLLAAALIASSVGIVGTAPAYAAPAAPTLSNLSTSVAGHVTGTVTAGPDAESVWVCWSRCQVNTFLTGAGWIPLDAATHSADFDLPTWGFSKATVTSVACATAPSSGSTCASGDFSATVESAPLTPTDLIPAVTWPSDTTIGHNADGSNQEASASVDDPAGGKLNLDWHTENPKTGSSDLITAVSHPGSTQLNLGDGVGYFRIFRCSEFSSYDCTYYPTQDSAQTTVARGAMTTYLNPAPITSTSPDSLAAITTDKHGTFQVDWHVSSNGQEVAGLTGSASGTLTSGGSTQITIPGAGLSDGEVTVDGVMTVNDPDFGPFSAAISNTLAIDRTNPVIEGMSVSLTEIHPRAIDALMKYQASTIKVHDDTQLDYNDKIEIRNASGTRVRLLRPSITSGTEERAVWNGWNDHGAVVPDGTYTVASVDSYGNRSALTRTIKVSNARGVMKVFKKTVSAAGSKQDKYVGRCSTLKSPASRGWSGSLGYFANTRCDSTTSAASAVGTVNAIRIPSAVAYNNLRIDTYGGAARGWRSSASSAYFNQSTLKWTTFRTVRGGLGTHTGTIVPLEQYVDAGRWVVWEFGTSNFNRYDVKSFTVVARYYVWE